MTVLTVLLAVRGAAETRLAQSLDGHPDIAVTRRCADLAETLAAAHAGLGRVAVVSDQPHLDRDSLAQLGQAGVVVIGAPSTIDAADHLSALGIVEVLPVAADESAIIETVLAAGDRSASCPPPPPVAPDPGGRGALIAVCGPAGAPGRTTVAVNLAAHLAAAGVRTLCADVDTYGGAVAHAFGLLDEAPGMAALARASLAGALRDDTIERYAVSVAPGLRVLGGISRPDRWPELSRSALEPVWERLASHAGAVVVDCGFCLEEDEDLAYDTLAPQRNGATLSALSAADVVVVVGRAEPLGIERLVLTLQMLDDSGRAQAARRLVVVNRVRESVVGPRPHQAVADALRRFAGVEQVWPIPDDPTACDVATLAGRTLRECAPRSAASRSLAALAEEIAGAVSGEPGLSQARTARAGARVGPGMRH
ncbi:hypothetical protein RN607_10885 [Demequina capsici]|uniref:CobQ/CobB/MinD/ParA nucleotide binding domain-containing protein n=1 Tax=Demequina capsici TaxID=3075620 RepID=A0AA96F4V4_9MICO|nr:MULTISPECIES: hypothetical protein [unclassified Demequina]WNM23857.1 hypothetical protein RN606_10885 [Demequina sp. OYTSA14]WNM26696.1 hypothetical protein RN607_10885 [Demequina sp. PMTSA13]